jgi:pre-mRNA-splicing factor SYF1
VEIYDRMVRAVPQD